MTSPSGHELLDRRVDLGDALGFYGLG